MGYKIKVSYRYREYPDNPEATELSELRARQFAWIEHVIWILCGLMIIGALLAKIDTLAERVLIIVSAVIIFLLEIFVISPWYESQTQKKITKLITKQQDSERKKSIETADKKKRFEEALKSHDVDALVKMNYNAEWRDWMEVRNKLNDHEEWMKDHKQGKRLVVVGEEIYHSNFKNRVIKDAIFSHCRFYKVDLSSSKFVNCNFYYSQFVKCKMKDTQFPDSNMEGTMFS